MPEPKCYKIVVEGEEIETIYLADGIFHATEFYLLDTGTQERLWARLCTLRDQDLITLTIPQLTRL